VTDSQGRAIVSFNLPDNLTTWRATATAHTMDTALGREINKVITAKEFFVRVDTPRFITQHDGTRILAVVHNETGSRQTALVRIRAANLTLQGDLTQTVTLDDGKTGTASWPVVADGNGEARITVTA